MPQMAPMMWSTLYFYPLILIMLCAIFLNSSKNFVYKKGAEITSKSVNNNWVW